MLQRYRILTAHWFWDLLTAGLLLVGVSAVIAAMTFSTGWMTVALAIPPVVGILVLLWAACIEPQLIMVNHQILPPPFPGEGVRGRVVDETPSPVPSPSLTRRGGKYGSLPPLRIALFADLHLGPYKHRRFLRRIVKRINRLEPDLILYLGDFVFDPLYPLPDLTELSKLRAPLGVYGVFGNHDSGHFYSFTGHPYQTIDRRSALLPILENTGMQMLRNRSVIIGNGQKTSEVLQREPLRSFAIIGIDDMWGGSDLEEALHDIPEDIPVILLSHQPDIIRDPRSARASLILSAHTHGGQARLPFIGPLSHLPTSLGRHYDQGAFPLENGGTLYITHGTGESIARVRLFCPPEIVLLEIAS